ncbi:MAG: hypothetical protein V4739_10950 [Pseudomonadota bacterium]
MTIPEIQHMSPTQLRSELQQGAKFVVYQYCISIVVMSFKRSSRVYFIPAQGTRRSRSVAGYCALSLVLGWWGFPWGPIWTFSTLVGNLNGGVDVTAEMSAALSLHGASA